MTESTGKSSLGGMAGDEDVRQLLSLADEAKKKIGPRDFAPMFISSHPMFISSQDEAAIRSVVSRMQAAESKLAEARATKDMHKERAEQAEANAQRLREALPHQLVEGCKFAYRCGACGFTFTCEHEDDTCGSCGVVGQLTEAPDALADYYRELIAAISSAPIEEVK